MFNRLEKHAARIVGIVDRSMKVESVYNILHEDDALDTDIPPGPDTPEIAESDHYTARQESVQSLNVRLESQ
jgi:hypothetical protein